MNTFEGLYAKTGEAFGVCFDGFLTIISNQFNKFKVFGSVGKIGIGNSAITVPGSGNPLVNPCHTCSEEISNPAQFNWSCISTDPVQGFFSIIFFGRCCCIPILKWPGSAWEQLRNLLHEGVQLCKYFHLRIEQF